MKWTYDEKGNYICGDYVITSVNNAFNNKRSYWISKKDYTMAFYCFTYINVRDFFKQMENPQVWIDYYEGRVTKKEALDAGNESK